MPGSRVGFTQRFHCRFQFTLPIGILVWRRARATRCDANTRAPGQKLVQIGAAPHPGAAAAAASCGLQAAFFLGFPEGGGGFVAAVEGGFGGGEEGSVRHGFALGLGGGESGFFNRTRLGSGEPHSHGGGEAAARAMNPRDACVWREPSSAAMTCA